MNIKDENLLQAQWLMGGMSGLICGVDNKVHPVKIKTQSSELMWPVRKICILPVEPTESASLWFKTLMIEQAQRDSVPFSMKGEKKILEQSENHPENNLFMTYYDKR